MKNKLYKFAELFLQAAEAKGQFIPVGKFTLIINKDSTYTTVTIRLQRALEQALYKKYAKKQGEDWNIREKLQTFIKHSLAGAGYEVLSRQIQKSNENYFSPYIQFSNREENVKDSLSAIYKTLSKIDDDTIIGAIAETEPWETIPELPTEEPNIE